MFGSSVLDVAVGLVFIFLLLSVFATAIHELLFSLLNMRGRALLRGIGNLLDDPHARGLAAKIYTHGQVFGLYDGGFDAQKKGKLPSYIPSRNFALALMGSVEASFSEVKVVPSASTMPPVPGAQATPAVQEVIVLTQAFKDAVTALAASNEKVGKPLLAMMNMAGNDAAKMQRSVEEWFNSGMDRVSGRYKYSTQWTLFFLGLVIALTLNASSTRYLTQLSRDSTLRASLVAAAESSKASPNQTDAAGAPDATQKKIQDVEGAFSQVNSIGVPLGWHHNDLDEFHQGWRHTANIAVGWLVTAVAISLGAPFWFDILNKIMVIRSTVKPREKSHDEGSKD